MIMQNYVLNIDIATKNNAYFALKLLMKTTNYRVVLLWVQMQILLYGTLMPLVSSLQKHITKQLTLIFLR